MKTNVVLVPQALQKLAYRLQLSVLANSGGNTLPAEPRVIPNRTKHTDEHHCDAALLVKRSTREARQIPVVYLQLIIDEVGYYLNTINGSNLTRWIA